MKRERQLHNSGRKTEDDIESLAKSNAYQSFKEDCITPITKVNDKIPYVCVSGDASSQLLRRSFPDAQIR